LEQQKPDGPTADDSHGSPEGKLAKVEGIQSNSERFKHRSFRIGKTIGNRVQKMCRPSNILPEAAIIPIVACVVRRRAEIGVPVSASSTVTARNARVHCYPTPAEGTFLNDAGELMPQN
jgi:hypothetical protein